MQIPRTNLILGKKGQIKEKIWWLNTFKVNSKDTQFTETNKKLKTQLTGSLTTGGTVATDRTKHPNRYGSGKFWVPSSSHVTTPGTMASDHTSHRTRPRWIRLVNYLNPCLRILEERARIAAIHETTPNPSLRKVSGGENSKSEIHLHRLHHREGLRIDLHHHHHHLHRCDRISHPSHCNSRTSGCGFTRVFIHASIYHLQYNYHDVHYLHVWVVSLVLGEMGKP